MDAQRLFEHARGARVVRLRQRRLPETDDAGHHVGRSDCAVSKSGCALSGSAAIEIEAPEPDEGRHVVGV
jgi:hypothetical protein